MSAHDACTKQFACACQCFGLPWSRRGFICDANGRRTWEHCQQGRGDVLRAHPGQCSLPCTVPTMPSIHWSGWTQSPGSCCSAESTPAAAPSARHIEMSLVAFARLSESDFCSYPTAVLSAMLHVYAARRRPALSTLAGPALDHKADPASESSPISPRLTVNPSQSQVPGELGPETSTLNGTSGLCQTLTDPGLRGVGPGLASVVLI